MHTTVRARTSMHTNSSTMHYIYIYICILKNVRAYLVLCIISIIVLARVLLYQYQTTRVRRSYAYSQSIIILLATLVVVVVYALYIYNIIILQYYSRMIIGILLYSSSSMHSTSSQLLPLVLCSEGCTSVHHITCMHPSYELVLRILQLVSYIYTPRVLLLESTSSYQSINPKKCFRMGITTPLRMNACLGTSGWYQPDLVCILNLWLPFIGC